MKKKQDHIKERLAFGLSLALVIASSGNPMAVFAAVPAGLLYDNIREKLSERYNVSGRFAFFILMMVPVAMMLLKLWVISSGIIKYPVNSTN